VRGGLPVPLPDPRRFDAGRLRAFWPKVWRVVGRVPFSEDLVSAWYCWADPKTPAHVKAVLAGALAYFVIPTDLVPDVIAGLGFTDDATVLATAVGLAGAHIRRRHKQAARRLLRKTENAGG
jgi:uncharacterized membrane protein YkvA (DUF1232 family)